MKRIAVVPGDGIGPEVTAEVLKILTLCRGRGLPLETEAFDYGAECYLSTGRTLGSRDLEELAGFDAIFVGAFGDPRIPDMRHARDILLGLRRGLDLYVNERPCRLLHARISPLKEDRGFIDLVIFRENTEGEYAEIGGNLRKGSPDEVAVESTIATRHGVERIIRHAFREVRRRSLGSVTLCDKHNAQRNAGDLWHRVFLEVAPEFPDVSARHAFMDTVCAELVLDPARHRAVVTSNLFGDILSDLGAALAGGLGIAPSANYNPESGKAMFEPVHGSAPDIAGRGEADPLAALLSAAMMLEFLGFLEDSAALRAACCASVDAGETTRDLGGTLGTGAAGDAVARRFAAHLEGGP